MKCIPLFWILPSISYNQGIIILSLYLALGKEPMETKQVLKICEVWNYIYIAEPSQAQQV